MGLARWTLGLLALLLIGVGAPALSEGPVPFDPPAAVNRAGFAGGSNS